jgi:hypothetical protein
MPKRFPKKWIKPQKEFAKFRHISTARQVFVATFSTVLIVSPSLVAMNVKSLLGCLPPPVLLSPKYYV